MTTAEERLDQLERQVGRYRKATVLMAVLLVAGVVMTNDADSQNRLI